MHKYNPLCHSTTWNIDQNCLFLQDPLHVWNVLHQFDVGIGRSLTVRIIKGAEKKQRMAEQTSICGDYRYRDFPHCLQWGYQVQSI